MDETRSSLLSRVRDFGDDSAWSEFDGVYRPMLAGYARRCGLGPAVAEEIAQECLAAIVDRIRDFRRQRSFRRWLRGMVTHKVADHLRREKRERRRPSGSHTAAGVRVSHPDEIWEQTWNASHLRYFIAGLRDEFAEHTLRAFAMYVLEERPVEEISRLLGMSPNQIYVAKSRVLRRLKDRYADQLEALYGGGT
ncbi:MAG: sigma-70 family RNA polymerase sigma factor [Phycisphaerae bacterium]|nr:sigma-70 family RNA polymerase sigma factor [Phycisphaerae bacterium]